MKLFILFACVAAVLAQGTEEGKCGCCPDPCCCVCVTSSTTTPTTTTTTQAPATTTEFIPVCTVSQDVVMIVDGSGSIDEDEWALAQSFIQAFINQLSAIGDDGSRVGMVTYSLNVTDWWGLDAPETASREALLAAIAGVTHDRGMTNTIEAMEKAVEDIFISPADNPDAPNVAVIITDGLMTHRQDEIASMAAQLQDKALVVVIGISDMVNEAELIALATDGEENVFFVESFESLIDYLSGLVYKACTEPPTRPPRPTSPPAEPPVVVTSEECFCCCPPPPGSYYGPHVLRKNGCC